MKGWEEVDRGRPKSREYWGLFFGRPDGFGSSDFAQFVDVLIIIIEECARSRALERVKSCTGWIALERRQNG